jgi:anti-anti-sigma regulatory factor
MVVIDLSRASTDSAGTGVLICAVARAKERGQRVAIVATDPLQLEVLWAVGLDGVIPVVRSEPEGLRLLAHDPVADQGQARGAKPDHAVA